MHANRNRRLAALATVTLVPASLVAALASAQSDPPAARLFSDHRVATAAARAGDTAARPQVAWLARADWARQVQLVQADATRIGSATRRLSVSLVPGEPLAVDQLSSYRNQDGSIVWTGVIGGDDTIVRRLARFGDREIVDDPLNRITLVRVGDTLTGSARVGGRLFRIEPVAGGRHAIVEVDPLRLPPDDAPGVALPQVAMAAASADATKAAAAPTTIRVGVFFTRNAAALIGSETGWAQAVVAEANDAYSISGVGMRLQLAGVRTLDYAEANPGGPEGPESYQSFATDLRRFRTRGDGFMDGVHGVRNETSADLMVLVRYPNDALCGQATSIGSTAPLAFAAVSVSCGPGVYTFTHEIGHLQGARHDFGHDDSLEPKAYAHGMIRTDAPGGRYRTLMSTCSDGQSWCWNTPRVNLVSNPDRNYNGVATGTAARADNRRAMNESRAEIAGFR